MLKNENKRDKKSKATSTQEQFGNFVSSKAYNK